MSTVVIVAADHFLQNLESTCLTTEGKEWELTQKEALKARLQALITQHKVELIGEEARLDRDCLGKQLADAHGCKYCNLTMPWEQRRKHGVEENYEETREARELAYKVFERFMFETIQRCRMAVTSILIICGSNHMKNVAALFDSPGDKVLTEDTTQSEWYRGRPIESASGVTGFDRN
jgi:hypothetical protein